MNVHWLALGALLASGCAQVDRPNRPLPEGFTVRPLSGALMHREDFKGRPWLINLWVPG